MNNTGILLESGTGEVEVLEFTVGSKHYAINVLKTKEILMLDNITKIPNVDPSVAGATLVRDDIITVIDLKYTLEKQYNDTEKRMIILCEFNRTKVAFLVDKVLGIHRIGWDNIRKPDSIAENSLVIGNILMGNNKILMLLDFEKIVMDIMESYGGYDKRIEKIQYSKDRSDSKVIIAEDSRIIRKMLSDVLMEAGYSNLTFFDDGEQTLDYLRELLKEKGERFLENVDALITDIEMPQMDGHTLTRRIKEDNILRKLPVIIFSSLITDDLYHKGQAVGADAQINKPDIDKLVKLVDDYTLNHN
ncbi:chemotaxis protein [Clostridium ganghwense]|uniref:Stage 0 sporulation protein A homolog n=1 Tax=Clostridium ganghwense TaxID=312089 RepID=A0ABT4CKW3_9CLOT|nr:chemotaxis protein [Clostridium ganghwense]MCY6369679.1 chemotaxis protein [Clostridium ganghwense]